LTIEEAFGEVIRELRKAQQISQEKLAEISNLDRSPVFCPEVAT
jgi:transcriptional regulator with XRE-family HTH domain